MILRQKDERSFIVKLENDKDIRMFRAFCHLDHFADRYDSDSDDVACNLPGEQTTVEEDIIELGAEIAGDSIHTYDEGGES